MPFLAAITPPGENGLIRDDPEIQQPSKHFTRRSLLTQGLTVEPQPQPAAPTEQIEAVHTPAPDVENQETLTANIVRTEYVTVGNIVSKILWQEEVVYVTQQVDVTTTITVGSANYKLVKKAEPTGASQEFAHHALRHRHAHHH